MDKISEEFSSRDSSCLGNVCQDSFELESVEPRLRSCGSGSK